MIIGGVLLFCLLSAGGIGAGAYFYYRGSEKKADEKTDLSKRFQGRWQGTRSGSDRLKLQLHVSPETFMFTATNVVVNEGATFQHKWNTVKTTDNTLLIRQERVDSGKFHEWLITFKSPDEMSVKSMTDNGTIGDFTRLAKDAP